MNTIKVLKLISGEEVIMRSSKKFDGGKWEGTHARILVLQQGPDGATNISMIPWLLSDPDGACVIYKKSVAGSPVSIPKALEDAYLTQTSPIVL